MRKMLFQTGSNPKKLILVLLAERNNLSNGGSCLGQSTGLVKDNGGSLRNRSFSFFALGLYDEAGNGDGFAFFVDGYHDHIGPSVRSSPAHR